MKYIATIEFEVPDNITQEEVDEWFGYEIIRKYPCKNNNPIIDKDMSNFVISYELKGINNENK